MFYHLNTIKDRYDNLILIDIDKNKLDYSLSIQEYE